MWSICQDLLLNGLVVWASSKLYLGGLVIKHQQALQAGAGEVIRSLLDWSMEHNVAAYAPLHTQSHHLLPQRDSAEKLTATQTLSCSNWGAHDLLEHITTCIPQNMANTHPLPSTQSPRGITLTGSQSPSDLSTHMHDHMFRHIALNRDKLPVHTPHMHVCTQRQRCIQRLRALQCLLQLSYLC